MSKLSIPLTNAERNTGWLYWTFQMFFLPIILQCGNQFLSEPLSDVKLNFLLFGINFICVTVIFRSYLITALKNFLKRPFHILVYALFGFLFYWILKFWVNMGIFVVKPDFINQNDANITKFYLENFILISISTVLLAPVVEELFYRGLFFGALHKKGRVLAYIVSAAVFSSIHIVGYVNIYDPLSLMLSFVQYLPAGLALAWSYERADNIFAPILIHATINLIATTATR